MADLNSKKEQINYVEGESNIGGKRTSMDLDYKDKEVWKTEKQNEIKESIKTDIKNMKKDVDVFDEKKSLANLQIMAKPGDSVAAIVLAVENLATIKANKLTKKAKEKDPNAAEVAKDIDLGWGTVIEYYQQNGEMMVMDCKMIDAKILLAGDSVSFFVDQDGTSHIYVRAGSQKSEDRMKDFSEKISEERIKLEAEYEKLTKEFGNISFDTDFSDLTTMGYTKGLEEVNKKLKNLKSLKKVISGKGLIDITLGVTTDPTEVKNDSGTELYLNVNDNNKKIQKIIEAGYVKSTPTT
jgi:hypothetical protein